MISATTHVVIKVVNRSLGRKIATDKTTAERGEGVMAAMPISTAAAASRTTTVDYELVGALPPLPRTPLTRTGGGTGINHGPGGLGAPTGGDEVGKDTTAPTKTTGIGLVQLRASTNRTRFRILAATEALGRSCMVQIRRWKPHLHPGHNHQVT